MNLSGNTYVGCNAVVVSVLQSSGTSVGSAGICNGSTGFMDSDYFAYNRYLYRSGQPTGHYYGQHHFASEYICGRDGNNQRGHAAHNYHDYGLVKMRGTHSAEPPASN